MGGAVVTTAPTITAEWLRKRNACEGQVAIFAAEWPDGVQLSEPGLLRAVALKLDLYWLAGNVLSPPAREAYREAVAPADKAYDEAMALWRAGSEHGWEV